MSVSKKLVAAISAAAVAGVAFIATPALAEDGAQSGVTIEAPAEEAAPVETEPTTEAPAPVVEDSVPSQAPAAPDGTATADEPSVEPTTPAEEVTDKPVIVLPPFDFVLALNDEGKCFPEITIDDTLLRLKTGQGGSDGWQDGVFVISLLPADDEDVTYVFSPGQQSVWTFYAKDCPLPPAPEVVTIPSFSLPAEVDDATWEPTLPDGATIDSDTGWKDGSRVITVAPKDGYAFTDGQETSFTVKVKEIPEPEAITVPSFTLPAEVDDATWEPTLPDGATIDSDTGWKDGSRVITVAPKDGYAFTDGQETSFTVKVKEKPAPVDPVDPVEPTDPVTPVTPVEPSTPATPSQGDGKTTGESQKPAEESTTSTSSKSDRGVSANTGLEEGGKTPLFAGLAGVLVGALGGAAWLRRRS